MNTVTQIRSIKANIQNAEISLDVFMDADLSDAAVRAEMRRTLNNIEAMEAALSSVLAAAE